MSGEFQDGLPVIHARKNDRLRLARALQSARGRRQRQRFLVEGPKALLDLLARRPDALEQLLVRAGPERTRGVEAVLEAARAAGVPAYPVAPELFAELAPSETPQGLLGIARLRWSPLEALCAGEDPSAPRALIGCLGVQDPGNLGTILRTARFFGCSGAVILPGTQDPWSPKVVRSAAGALLDRPPARADDLPALLAAAAAAGLQPLALAAHGGAPLAEAELPARCLLLLGAEGAGLPEEATDLPAVTIESPAGAEVESLNVAVACALVAHAWCARHGTARHGDA
ncbi:MAG: TrmH family RNA methyltransferase [Planctomycetota bacterium]